MNFKDYMAMICLCFLI